MKLKKLNEEIEKLEKELELKYEYDRGKYITLGQIIGKSTTDIAMILGNTANIDIYIDRIKKIYAQNIEKIKNNLEATLNNLDKEDLVFIISSSFKAFYNPYFLSHMVGAVEYLNYKKGDKNEIKRIKR